MADTTTLTVDDIEFVKELYPRLREDDAAIERYRAAIDRLPPITVARGRVLVDGFHRWQAYRREGRDEIEAEDLGNLTDVEILKESLRRNSSHGRQLETADKRRNADILYRQGTTDYDEIADLLSISESTAQEYCRGARRDEKAEQQERAWDLWLDCWTDSDVADEVGVGRKTVSDWASAKIQELGDSPLVPESRQHFDVWKFPPARDDSAGTASYFGRIPPQVIENLLWLYTEPGDVVFDPFVGGGTTIEVAKRMGRRVWASDIEPATPTLPIRTHNIMNGWPDDYPGGRFPKPSLVILDPPYWQQAAGRYPDHPDQLGDIESLDEFYVAFRKVVATCMSKLDNDGRLAFIVSPTQTDERVVDHAFDMMLICGGEGLQVERRIIVPYSTQQATGQQVTWARENRRLLKLYRDLVVLRT